MKPTSLGRRVFVGISKQNLGETQHVKWFHSSDRHSEA
jgi:hypothetical protein